MPVRALLCIALAVATAHAEPLACPDAVDSCELEITGKLTYAKRDRLAKWDNLRISTRNGVVKASINIPHRTRLKLKVGTRYRFTVAARTPFGPRELWVINAR